MTEVKIYLGWISDKGNVDNFLQWVQNEVGDDNWTFRAGPNLDSGTFGFTSAEDAIAFKLKFGA